MGLLLQTLDRLLPDPEPPLVFEVGDGIVLGARRSGRTVQARAQRELPASDQADPEGPTLEGLHGAVEGLLSELQPLPSRSAAVLLPDDAARLAVFEFDKLPRRPQEFRQAVEDRFRNSLPFDARNARIAFKPQAGGTRPSVLAAAVSTALVRRCEEEFEAAGIRPDFVGTSCAAALNLVGCTEMTVLLTLSGQAMTIAAVENGAVRLVRRISLPAGIATDIPSTVQEVLADLFPTIVYIEENLERSVSRLILAGFGELQGLLLEPLRGQLGFPVEPLLDDDAAAAPCGAGLLGYIHG